MAKMVQTGEFFVVGGSVQADRPSYIERAADGELFEALRQGEFCYVLEPRASGKSSLMGRAVRRVREDGQLAAAVDLTQISARERDATPGRWYYSIAYRIVRELRLKLDLQTWWQERNTLSGEQRLLEFFRDLVLANTTARVCIFFDDMERALGAPFAEALFTSVKACYAGRTGDPELARLNFVMVGAASARDLCPDPSISPFEDGRRIALPDFTLDELQQLAPGFGVDLATARQLLAQIFTWTRGQPYLTQKLARQLARSAAAKVDEQFVERLVRERFLSAAASRDEALLSHIRALLTTPSPDMRQALALLGRVCKGIPVASDLNSVPQSRLRLSGVVIDTENGQLALRNPIYEQVFTARWVNSVLPFEWRQVFIAAAAASLLILVPLWYLRVLPRPYVAILMAGQADEQTVVAAYERLRGLPGFAQTADRLLTDLMTRRSQDAQTLAAAMAADRGLRQVPGRGALADEMQAEYWFRQARAAAAREERDAALLFSLAGVDAFAEPAGRSLVGELIDVDYGLLRRTLRAPGSIGSWLMNWSTRDLTLVDQAHRVFRYGPAAGGPAEIGRLTALQYIPVSRDLAVDETGSVGRFELVLDLDHPATQQLRLTLQSPDGASARLSLANRTPQRSGRLRVRSAGTPLSALADAGRQGVWRLTLADETQGDAGLLARWSLSFSSQGEIWTDTPESGLAIPDPIRTDQIEVRMSSDGGLAAAVPSRADGVGAVTLWDLKQGTALADLQLSAAPTAVGFVADGTRLYTVTENVLTLWDVARAAPVARIAAEAGFTLAPAVSPDGAYLMVAEALAEAAPLFSLLRASDGRPLASGGGSAQARAWWLGPGAGYLAVVETDRLMRVFEPRRRVVLATLAHTDRIEAVLPLNNALITADSRGVIRYWQWSEQGGDLQVRRVAVTRAPESLSAAGNRLAYQAMDYAVAVRNLPEGSPVAVRPGIGRPLELELSADGSALASRTANVLRIWALPPSDGEPQPTAAVASLALDAGADEAVFGDWDGHLRTVSRADPTLGMARDDLGLEYIGHNGPITAVAVDSGRGIAASGGSDGVVRLWDLKSGAPTAAFLRHPQGPIQDLKLSHDGRFVASAAEYAARVWDAADGRLLAEIPVNGAAMAVAFVPGGERVLTGDSAGNVLIAELGAPERAQALLAAGPVTALAVALDGGQFAVGGAGGSLELWRLPDGSSSGSLSFPSPIRRVSFDRDGQHLLVETAGWYHRVDLAGSNPRLADSRLAPLGAASQVAQLGPGGRTLRVVTAGPRLEFRDLDMNRPNAAPVDGEAAALRQRWRRALDLSLDSDGLIQPLSLASQAGAARDAESVN